MAVGKMNWMLLVQFAVDGAFAGEQKEQLVGAVDGAPVQAQPGHQFEDQVEGDLAHPHALGCVRAQPNPGKDALDRVAGAQVRPLLLGLVENNGSAWCVFQSVGRWRQHQARV